MKLYTAPVAPNPRRVRMFIAEKRIEGIEFVTLDLGKREHVDAPCAGAGPTPLLPVLELDDGRQLAETRAICGYLEALHPEPNLYGVGPDERAFVEMTDRQAELHLLQAAVETVRHGHPGFAAVQNPQIAAVSQLQRERFDRVAEWFDARLATRPYLAGERFTVADITAFCALEFMRVLRYRPGAAGLDRLQAWHERIATRPSAQA